MYRWYASQRRAFEARLTLWALALTGILGFVVGYLIA